jgi:hypothetical protein
MAMKDLAETRTDQGALTSVWFDEQEDTVVVQHEFVHLSFGRPDFEAFVDALVEARARLGMPTGNC